MVPTFLALLAAVAVQSSAPEAPNGASMRFAPFVVRVTFGLAPGQGVSDCSVGTEGDPDNHWLDDPCGNLTPALLGAAGLDAQARGRATVLLRLEANGAATSPDTAPGRLVSRSRVRFELNADGSVARCERDEWIGGRMEMPLCAGAFPSNPRPFVAAADARAPRRGRLGMTFYLAS